MFTLREQAVVHAPIDRCFLLSTSIAIVQKELGMHPVSGRTTGLVTSGDKVLWKGWRMGLPQFHHSLISKFDRPHFFQDTMVAGRFKTFQHDHAFAQGADHSVTLADELRFTMPFGILGWILGRWIMVPHIRRLMRRRLRLLKRIAETDQWRDYLPAKESHLTV